MDRANLRNELNAILFDNKNNKINLQKLKSKKAIHFLQTNPIPLFNSLNEQAWAILNNVVERPTCKVCGTLTNFNRVSVGYFKYCSLSCSTKDTSKKGKDHHFSTESIKNKIAKTNIEKYGVKTSLCLKENRELGILKSIHTIYDRGKNFKSKEFTEQRAIKINNKEYHTQNKQTIEKIKNANKINYDQNVLSNKLSILENSGYILQSEFKRFSNSLWQHSCGEKFYAIPNSRFEVFCPLCKKSGISLPHQKLIERLRQENINDFKINDRRIIAPKELDLLFLEQKVAIEINGIYYHNDNVISKYYHQEKLQLCKERGIRLLHFWDYEISEKLDLIISIIKNALGKNEKIAARKCIVKEITNKEGYEFCNLYHLNGSTNCSKSVGCFFNNELVGVLTVGKSRFGKQRDELEIIRVCFKSGINVIGGFSKMLSFIVKFYWDGDIISYQDGRLGFGDMYLATGFKYIKTLSPNYHYVKGTQILSRQQAMKFKLQKLLGEKFNPQSTEKENMKNSGWFICYDAGHQLWKLEKKI